MANALFLRLQLPSIYPLGRLCCPLWASALSL